MSTTAVEFRRGMMRGKSGTIAALKAFGTKGQSFIGGPIGDEERRSHDISAWLLEDYSDGDSSVTTVMPTHAVSGSMAVRLGSLAIEIFHPGKGHTAGDLVVLLPAYGILATGDLLMWPVTFVGSTSFPQEFARSLDALIALKPRIVIPGHGPVMRADTAAAHLSITARLLHSMNEQVARAVGAGSTLAETRTVTDLTAFESALTNGAPLRRALFEYYVRQSGIARAYDEQRARSR